jgi:hypothetical protein
MFEWKISFDTVLTVGSFLVFITLYISNIRTSTKVLSLRFETIDASIEDFRNDIKKLQEVIITQALQNQRLNNMEERNNATGKRLDEIINRFNTATTPANPRLFATS